MQVHSTPENVSVLFQGYKYAGTQYSKECFCGDSYDKYGPADNCDMACSGDASQTCGGTWALQVYEIGKGFMCWDKLAEQEMRKGSGSRRCMR